MRASVLSEIFDRGHEEVVEWLLKNDILRHNVYAPVLITPAVRAGHLRIVQALCPLLAIRHFLDAQLSDALEAAIECGHHEIWAWLTDYIRDNDLGT